MKNEMLVGAKNILSIRADNLFSSDLKKDLAPGPKRIAVALEGRLLRDLVCGLLKGLDRGSIDGFDSLDQMEQKFGLLNPPDMVITGIGEQPAQDLAAIRAMRIKMPSLQWLVLSQLGTPEIIRESLDLGVSILLLEDSSSDVLKLATEMVLLGHPFIPATLAQKLHFGAMNETAFLPKAMMGTPHRPVALRSASAAPSGVAVPAIPPTAANQAGCKIIENRAAASETTTVTGRGQGTLSERELQILSCLTEGFSNKLIARRLTITEATVKVHVKALLRKMQVANRTQAALAAGNFLNGRATTM